MKAKKRRSGELLRDDWIAIARKALIKEGIAGVKIDRLAKSLGVTRGGFYWRFKNPQDLFDALLEDWRSTNTAPWLDALLGEGTPGERFYKLEQVWIEEKEYQPKYDMAVRSWGHVSSKVARAVHSEDGKRIEALRRLFIDAGNSPAEASIRARIVYYHQIGYYAMGIKETYEERERLGPLYYRVLTGFNDERARMFDDKA